MNRSLFHFAAIILMVSCGGKKPPNVIIIFTDDQGYQDVGSFGSPDILTPHLDKMASEGVKLTSFYAAQAVCTASRAALLTGCYPNRIGIHQAFMPNSNIGINPDETTIAEMLKLKNYSTAIFGKWHLGDDKKFLPLNHGFDEYYGIPYSNDMWPLHPQQGSIFNFGPLPLYENNNIVDTITDQSQLTTRITEKSVSFIQRNKDKSFFLYVAHPQPHVPLFVSDKFQGKSKRGLYGDVIMEIDWSVGEILNALKENDLEENTIVIFTSDNGPWLSYGDHAGSALPFREGKGTAFEGGHREPFIIKYPKQLKPGTVVNVPVMAIDLLPTLAFLTDAQMPDSAIDGKNVWDIIAGRSSESPHEAYYFYYKINELHGVRYKNWKLYFPHIFRTLNGRKGGIEGFPVNYDQQALDEIHLYDLSRDINESHNVAKEYPDVVAKIERLADGIRIRLGDNLTDVKGLETRPPGQLK